MDSIDRIADEWEEKADIAEVEETVRRVKGKERTKKKVKKEKDSESNSVSPDSLDVKGEFSDKNEEDKLEDKDKKKLRLAEAEMLLFKAPQSHTEKSKPKKEAKSHYASDKDTDKKVDFRNKEIVGDKDLVEYYKNNLVDDLKTLYPTRGIKPDEKVWSDTKSRIGKNGIGWILIKDWKGEGKAPRNKDKGREMTVLIEKYLSMSEGVPDGWDGVKDLIVKESRIRLNLLEEARRLKNLEESVVKRKEDSDQNKNQLVASEIAVKERERKERLEYLGTKLVPDLMVVYGNGNGLEEAKNRLRENKTFPIINNNQVDEENGFKMATFISKYFESEGVPDGLEEILPFLEESEIDFEDLVEAKEIYKRKLDTTAKLPDFGANTTSRFLGQNQDILPKYVSKEDRDEEKKRRKEELKSNEKEKINKYVWYDGIEEHLELLTYPDGELLKRAEYTKYGEDADEVLFHDRVAIAAALRNRTNGLLPRLSTDRSLKAEYEMRNKLRIALKYLKSDHLYDDEKSILKTKDEAVIFLNSIGIAGSKEDGVESIAPVGLRQEPKDNPNEEALKDINKPKEVDITIDTWKEIFETDPLLKELKGEIKKDVWEDLINDLASMNEERRNNKILVFRGLMKIRENNINTSEAVKLWNKYKNRLESLGVMV